MAVNIANNFYDIQVTLDKTGAPQASRLCDGLLTFWTFLPGIILYNCLKLVPSDLSYHQEHVDISIQDGCTYSEWIFDCKYITDSEPWETASRSMVSDACNPLILPAWIQSFLCGGLHGVYFVIEFIVILCVSNILSLKWICLIS